MLPVKIITGQVSQLTGEPITPKNVLEQVMLEREAKTGRPTKYSEEVAQEAIRRYAQGELVADICRDPAMPSYFVFYHWIRTFPEFQHSYECARKTRASVLADKHLEITLKAATLTGKDDRPDGCRVATQGLQWQAERLDPDMYGQRQKVDISITNDLATALLKAKDRLKSLDAIESTADRINEN